MILNKEQFRHILLEAGLRGDQIERAIDIYKHESRGTVDVGGDRGFPQRAYIDADGR